MAVGVAVILAIFLRSRRDEISHHNVVSEVADSGLAVQISTNPEPKKKVKP